NHAAHGDEHGHHGHDDHAHGTLKSYTIGFILSVVLTAIPFWLVMGKVFEKSTTTAFVVLAFAAVQIVVHMIYFLHMNTKSEGGWSMLALIFTIVIVVITLSGSIWVMYHMNNNMMPNMVDPTHEMQGSDMANMTGNMPMPTTHHHKMP
ncbi:MAG TPA: cytochrome o ubiquinol oxidase subunit IV, partial [Oxalicibacterium sp.]|nr:cytochrome o ubiquinol oxidase subunit IV [Oxalicibacterium sp.]